jgi:RluA family pseudouridine synthase
VDPYRSGWTVAAFLAHRFRYHAPDVWAERIAQGAVRVNGAPAAPGHVVHRGDRLEYELWHEEPEVDFRHEILFEDDHVLAVSKSGNLPVHAGGKYIRNTLIAELRARYGPDLRPAHRLDRETSGIVLLAKNRHAAAALEREFRARRVFKAYVAILRGEVPREVVVDAPIARQDPAGGSAVRIVDPSGKPASTRFITLGSRPADGRWPARSFALVLPESGRTNQIRVHAAHLGHPVLGDKIYGTARDGPGRPTGPAASPDAPRHLLHCARLTVGHPAPCASPLRLDAPPPPDFADSWGGPLPPFAVSLAGLGTPPPGTPGNPPSEGRSP